MVLGQVKVANKSNEITAIPVLLSRLDIAGSVITMGCQKKIAQQIIEKDTDYILSLKGNQGKLHDDVTTYFESPLSPEIANISFDGGHGALKRALFVSPIKLTGYMKITHGQVCKVLLQSQQRGKQKLK